MNYCLRFFKIWRIAIAILPYFMNYYAMEHQNKIKVTKSKNRKRMEIQLKKVRNIKIF